MMRIIALLCIFLTSYSSGNILPSKLKCMDKLCLSNVSSGRIQQQTSPLFSDIKELKKFSKVYIKGKNFDSSNTLWLIEFDGQKGFVDLSLLKEFSNTVVNDLEVVDNPYYKHSSEGVTDETEENDSDGGEQMKMFTLNRANEKVIPSLDDDETESSELDEKSENVEQTTSIEPALTKENADQYKDKTETIHDSFEKKSILKKESDPIKESESISKHVNVALKQENESLAKKEEQSNSLIGSEQSKVSPMYASETIKKQHTNKESISESSNNRPQNDIRNKQETDPNQSANSSPSDLKTVQEPQPSGVMGDEKKVLSQIIKEPPIVSDLEDSAKRVPSSKVSQIEPKPDSLPESSKAPESQINNSANSIGVDFKKSDLKKENLREDLASKNSLLSSQLETTVKNDEFTQKSSLDSKSSTHEPSNVQTNLSSINANSEMPEDLVRLKEPSAINKSLKTEEIQDFNLLQGDPEEKSSDLEKSREKESLPILQKSDSKVEEITESKKDAGSLNVDNPSLDNPFKEISNNKSSISIDNKINNVQKEQLRKYLAPKDSFPPQQSETNDENNKRVKESEFSKETSLDSEISPTKISNIQNEDSSIRKVFKTASKEYPSTLQKADSKVDEIIDSEKDAASLSGGNPSLIHRFKEVRSNSDPSIGIDNMTNNLQMRKDLASKDSIPPQKSETNVDSNKRVKERESSKDSSLDSEISSTKISNIQNEESSIIASFKTPEHLEQIEKPSAINKAIETEKESQKSDSNVSEIKDSKKGTTFIDDVSMSVNEPHGVISNNHNNSNKDSLAITQSPQEYNGQQDAASQKENDESESKIEKNTKGKESAITAGINEKFLIKNNETIKDEPSHINTPIEMENSEEEVLQTPQITKKSDSKVDDIGVSKTQQNETSQKETDKREIKKEDKVNRQIAAGIDEKFLIKDNETIKDEPSHINIPIEMEKSEKEVLQTPQIPQKSDSKVDEISVSKTQQNETSQKETEKRQSKNEDKVNRQMAAGIDEKFLIKDNESIKDKIKHTKESSEEERKVDEAKSIEGTKIIETEKEKRQKELLANKIPQQCTVGADYAGQTKEACSDGIKSADESSKKESSESRKENNLIGTKIEKILMKELPDNESGGRESVRSPLLRLLLFLEGKASPLVNFLVRKSGLDRAAPLSRFLEEHAHMSLESVLMLASVLLSLLVVAYTPRVLGLSKDWRRESDRHGQLALELEMRLAVTEETREKLAAQNHSFEEAIEEYKGRVAEIQEDAVRGRAAILADLERMAAAHEGKLASLRRRLEESEGRTRDLEGQLTACEGALRESAGDRAKLERAVEERDALAGRERLLANALEAAEESLARLRGCAGFVAMFGDLEEEAVAAKVDLCLEAGQWRAETEEARVEAASAREDLARIREEVAAAQQQARASEMLAEEHERERLQAVREQEAAELKLQVLSDYFRDKELDLQRSLGQEAVERAACQERADALGTRVVALEAEKEALGSTAQRLTAEVKEAHAFLAQVKADMGGQIAGACMRISGLERDLQAEREEAKKLRNRLSSFVGPSPPRGQNPRERPSSRQSEAVVPPPPIFPLSMLPQMGSPRQPFSGRVSANSLSKKSNNS